MHALRTPQPASTRILAGVAATALTLALGLTATPTAHAAETYFCADTSASDLQYAPVAEVEAWAAGTAVSGLTVTSGTTPEAFTGSYVGFIADALGKDKDLLLFTMSSAVIDGTGGLKAAGIWAGMSGSPVYDSEGRLIGAVAYSLNSDNLPVAGVTPAEYMRNIGNTVVGTGSAKITATSENLEVTPAGVATAGVSLTGSTFSPVKTVNIAGPSGTKANAFTNRTLARTPKTAAAAVTLRSNTFLPAAALAEDLSAPLTAGGSIAVTYTSGDLIAGSIGTVTAICGDTVYAFGHPMEYIGRTNLLMANASTALIVPDGTGVYGSYKQASEIGSPVGTITQDRRFGIKGALGTTETVPVTVAVQDPSGTPVESYATEVIYPDILASAVAALVGQAAYEQLDQYNAGTGEATWTISFTRKDGSEGTLTNSRIVKHRYWFPDEIATYPAMDVWAIHDNGLEDVTVTDVEVTLKLISEDAISYKTSDVEVQVGPGTWSSLDGAKLASGTTYQARAAFTVMTNSTPGETVTGDAFAIRIGTKAVQRGTFTISRAEGYSAVCDADLEECDDWYYDDDSSRSFEDVLAGLDALEPGNGVDGVLWHKLKKGSSIRFYETSAPGYVTGQTEVAFRVK